MQKSTYFLFKAALIASIVLSTSGTAATRRFNQYVGFGDSALDGGYFRYNTWGDPIYNALTAAAVASGDTGGFVANGVINSIILANKFGLSDAPVGAPGGGSNYANGGSYTMIDYLPQPGNISAVTQIQNYTIRKK